MQPASRFPQTVADPDPPAPPPRLARGDSSRAAQEGDRGTQAQRAGSRGGGYGLQSEITRQEPARPPQQAYPADDLTADQPPRLTRGTSQGRAAGVPEQQFSFQPPPPRPVQQLPSTRPQGQAAAPPGRRKPSSPEEAAIAIQRHFRGYKVRQQVAQSHHQQGHSRLGGPGPRQPQQQQQQRVDFYGAAQPPTQPPSAPVIDISRLPRYGALAPPLPRNTGPPAPEVVLDQATGVFARNRGALRLGLENKGGWLEEAAVRMWAEFTSRQRKRHVPIPPDPNRRVLPASQGYRLRVLRVSDLPVHTTFDGRTFEFMLGVSLYDEAYGTFYGNTVYSQGDGYDRNRAAQRNAIDLDFSFDVFYHTSVSDPRCMAVVEVILLERMLDGVVRGQYSMGWALLPLFRVGVGAAGSLGGDVTLDALGSGKPLSVPLVGGTPRYLLLRHVYNEELRAPKVLPNCSITFQAEAYPAMDAFIPLLPEDFLVSYGDVVPGLRRFDTAGQLSVSAKQVISTLASPMLSPTYSVVLRRLQLALPAKLHELLATLEVGRQAGPGLPTASPSLPAVFSQAQPGPSGPLHYSIRVAVHNGRTFVGPSYELVNVTCMDVPGWKVLQVPAPDAVFDYVMGDVLTSIVIELMATPSQAVLQGAEPKQLLVGWTALVPFSFIADDGSYAEVAVGVHRYPLRVPRPAPLLRDVPVLNWRALLGDAMTCAVPEPMVEFQLFETGRTAIPPPLRARFAVQEQQRASLAALDERGMVPAQAQDALHQEHQFQHGANPFDQGLLPIRDEQPYLQADAHASIAVVGTQTSMRERGGPVHEERSRLLEELYSSRQAPLADTADRDQLRDIAATMQRQLELLTHAVDELKNERKSLRDSMLLLTDRPPPQPSPGPHMSPPGRQAQQDDLRFHQAHDEELRRMREMPATQHFGDQQAFSGGPLPLTRDPATVPSRLLMQQLHDAGMVDALPDDVQALLRRRGPAHGLAPAPVDLGIEAKDPRTASDIILQLLAYRHHDTLNAPAKLQSTYFTFQFYHFPPTTSDMAFLVQPRPEVAAPITTGRESIHPAAAAQVADAAAMSSTRILVTNHPLKRGAGLVMKYEVDGSREPLAAGSTAQAAAFEAHLAFASYLAARKLSVDVWDGQSLLQVGTASLELAPLLRQGREFAELLVEVPVMVADGMVAPTPQELVVPGLGGTGGATLLSRGSIIVRMINIGREPRTTTTQTGFDAAAQVQVGKRTRIRARPAWEVAQGAIAKELANGEHPAVKQQQQQPGFLPQTDAQGRPLPAQPLPYGPGPATPLDAARASFLQPDFGLGGHAQLDEAVVVKHVILKKSQVKSTRVRQVEDILSSERPRDESQAVPRPGIGGEEQFRHVQKQLLTDVSSARSRNKDAFIRNQLRKQMVQSQVVRPGYGEVAVFEFEFQNPFTQEMVFELHISDPREVSILTRMDEYRALRAAGARFLGAPSQPVGSLEQEVMAGNRLYLQGGERITLPLKIQSLAPPEGYGSLASASAAMQAPDAAGVRASGANGKGKQPGPAPGAGQGSAGHVVTVEVNSHAHGHPVSVLELELVPKPLIIDRTFRFYHAERCLMRQTVRLRHLPGADVAFPGATLRNLAVASSHPDVITGAGSAGLAGGESERDEVYIKFKCGAAPEVTHFYVLLYTDRLLSRPVEVWQVYVHALRKVDMRALVGQTSVASVVVRGASSSRRVAAFASHPDELQVTPDSFVLVAGALTELLINFRPVTSGTKDVKVHLVDVETRQLVYALIVAAEAQGPLVTRTFEVELPAGSVANKKISYTNPYQAFRTFSLRSNQSWLVQFTPTRLQMPGGATRPVGMTFDARAATVGIIDVLVFVNDEEDRTEECFRVRVRIYR